MTDARMPLGVEPVPDQGAYGSFGRGVRVQRKVIAALLLREMHTRYGRENIGYLWLILEPMTLAVMIALIHSRQPHQGAGDLEPVPLALLGYCTFMIFRGIFNRAEGAIEGNQSLLFHRTITIFDLLFARAVLEAAGCMLAFLILLGLSIGIGIAHIPARPMWLIFGVFLMFILSFGLSMLVSAGTHENRVLGRMVHPLSYIMLPLSGAFLPMAWLPSEFRGAVEYIPMAHVFEVLRYGQFQSSTLEYVDWEYLTGWILGSMFLGLLAISAVRSKLDMS